MSSRFAFLNRPTRLEAWVLQKLISLENHFHTRMRRESSPRNVFAASLLPVSALAACTSLLLSQKASFKEANEACQERFAIATPKLTSFHEETFENGSGSDLTPGLHCHCHSATTSPWNPNHDNTYKSCPSSTAPPTLKCGPCKISQTSLARTLTPDPPHSLLPTPPPYSSLSPK